MISRVFRDPSGLDSSQYPVREGDQAAALKYSEGGNVSLSLENASVDRIPEAAIHNSGFDGSTRSPRRIYQESIRRLKRSILPVRQEPEAARAEENEASYGPLDKTGSSNNRSTGRREESEENGLSPSEGPTRASQETIRTGQSPDAGGGPFQEGEKKIQKRCFINNIQCESSCMAYSNNLKGNCRILAAVDVFISNNKPSRPIPPAPPKVVP